MVVLVGWLIWMCTVVCMYMCACVDVWMTVFVCNMCIFLYITWILHTNLVHNKMFTYNGISSVINHFAYCRDYFNLLVIFGNVDGMFVESSKKNLWYYYPPHILTYRAFFSIKWEFFVRNLKFWKPRLFLVLFLTKNSHSVFKIFFRLILMEEKTLCVIHH